MGFSIQQITIMNIFSSFSGTFYEALEKDFDLLDEGQIPLHKKPRTCKKCHDRGYLGRNTQTLIFEPCPCLLKVVEYSLLKKKMDEYKKKTQPFNN